MDASPGFISRMDYGITIAVARGHPGDIPGFPVEMWTLGYNGCSVLVAGKLCPQQSVTLFSLSFLASR